MNHASGAVTPANPKVAQLLRGVRVGVVAVAAIGRLQGRRDPEG
jgi:hypothetical protein